MDFKREKRRGQNQKVRKSWTSEEGYRIIWRREVAGIAVPPAYQAAVLLDLPNGRQMQDRVGRSLFKTRKKAQEACVQHHKLWTKAFEASGIRAVKELFGKVPVGVPAWTRDKMCKAVRARLLGSYSSLEET